MVNFFKLYTCLINMLLLLEILTELGKDPSSIASYRFISACDF